MGVIQNNFSRLASLAAGTAIAIKKGIDTSNEEKEAEKITAEKEAQKIKDEKAEKRAKNKEEKKMAEDVATEADLINLGLSPVDARRYRLAQQMGLANPSKEVFNEKGERLGTYSEIAQILADSSLADALSQRLKRKGGLKLRKELIKSRSMNENVKNAVLATGGKI